DGTRGEDGCVYFGVQPAYGGDAAWTSWGSHAGITGGWGGAGAYEDVQQFDCNAWAMQYQQQQQQQAWLEQQQQQSQPQQPVVTPAPAPGTELLTELRLAELKRLIDRDSKSVPQAGELVFAPVSKEPGGTGETAASRAEKAEVPAAPLAGPFPCRGAFLPEDRKHKEMPVSEAELVWLDADSEHVSGWLWAYKEDRRDQGWIPAAAVEMFAYLEDEETCDEGLLPAEELEDEEDEDEEDEASSASDAPRSGRASARGDRGWHAGGHRGGDWWGGGGGADWWGGGGGDASWASGGWGRDEWRAERRHSPPHRGERGGAGKASKRAQDSEESAVVARAKDRRVESAARERPRRARGGGAKAEKEPVAEKGAGKGKETPRRAPGRARAPRRRGPRTFEVPGRARARSPLGEVVASTASGRG
ncbi:unnamed protein product, partial [Prorocentrum cordatum]